MDGHGFYGWLFLSAVDSLRTPTVVTAGVTAPLKWASLETLRLRIEGPTGATRAQDP